MPSSDTLTEHVANFNHGIRTGDFEPMIELFSDDAVVSFEGVPVGPFSGRQAIREAYRQQPPDDTIRVLTRRTDGEIISATYAWDVAPDQPAGDLILHVAEGLITRLTVTFTAGI